MADILERKKYMSYLPDFLKQFMEFQEIGKVVDPVIRSFDEMLGRVLNNAFIAECDEYGIRKYEMILKITPSADDTLESRRSRVALRWNDHIPYTYRVLIAKLNALCGVNNYDMVCDLKNYSISLHTHLSMSGQVKELEDLLDKMLPATMVFTISNDLAHEVVGSVHSYGVIVQTKSITITSEDQ